MDSIVYLIQEKDETHQIRQPSSIDIRSTFDIHILTEDAFGNGHALA